MEEMYVALRLHMCGEKTKFLGKYNLTIEGWGRGIMGLAAQSALRHFYKLKVCFYARFVMIWPRTILSSVSGSLCLNDQAYNCLIYL